MIKRLSATSAARQLSDLLSRVRYRGEVFDIERNGQVVARLGPAPGRKGTVNDLLALLDEHGQDPAFADDLEQIRAEQRPLGSSPWEP